MHIRELRASNRVDSVIEPESEFLDKTNFLSSNPKSHRQFEPNQ